MLKMEKMQPLLALCENHWKAEHILGQMLLQEKGPDFEADDDDDVSHVSTSVVSTSVGKPSASETVGVPTAATSQTSAINKRRRGHSSSSSKPKKKPAVNVALQHVKDTMFAPVTAPTLIRKKWLDYMARRSLGSSGSPVDKSPVILYR
ncbi:hypothetical protein SCP_0201690 [Sparassis crispa]|uniref:Uncharacterized protein n=1 Tax=Sparassis crispa TaxID=139825 RepID=A0A401G9X9_9APHY|nr:hypothetical protein SCP_0201690 [Sparassis crispa]GBE78972.1 hypothetical protein SCP_0201690 [Sparassis crispa]